MESKIMKVLLIEDNSGDAGLIREMIAEVPKEDIEMTRVSKLSEGLEYVVNNKIDVVLLDLSLPDSFGLDTFIGLYREISHIPIIVLSGISDEKIAIKAVQKGAQDYLLKGHINSSLLVRAMHYAIERKRVEEERENIVKQLSQAEKLASLGKLAGGVAHEINNPLTSILSTAELVLEDIPQDNNSLRNDIEQIIEESKRIRDTIKSFLGFAKNRDFDYKKNDINKLVESSLTVVGRGNLARVDVAKNYDPSIGEISVSRFHIEEMFVNIILNALHSMEGDGRLIITTNEEKGSVVVGFKDTGSGIEKEDLEKIFEPFFTTKDKKGTGLGLSTCSMIAARHGGKIIVDSKGPKNGAEFKVYLPIDRKDKK